MNYSQLGNELNMTRTGARALVLRNEKKLKKYLIYNKDKKVIGIKDDNLEDVRKLVVKNHNTITHKMYEIDVYKIKVDYLEQRVKDLEKSNEKLENENQKLSAELFHYQNLGFFQRLLAYRK